MARAANGGGPNTDFIMLAGLGLLAYMAMRPRAAVAAQNPQVRTNMPGQTNNASAYVSAGSVLAGLLGNLSRSGSADQVIGGSWATQFNANDPSTYFNDPTAYG
ncbi:hypothetical protein [Ralstonia sp.]|uniref:hypothetical protein n=1 Tax=Ralstonia sp. TaxID=54061 RepID=UPI0031D83112